MANWQDLVETDRKGSVTWTCHQCQWLCHTRLSCHGWLIPPAQMWWPPSLAPSSPSISPLSPGWRDLHRTTRTTYHSFMHRPVHPSFGQVKIGERVKKKCEKRFSKILDIISHDMKMGFTRLCNLAQVIKLLLIYINQFMYPVRCCLFVSQSGGADIVTYLWVVCQVGLTLWLTFEWCVRWGWHRDLPLSGVSGGAGIMTYLWVACQVGLASWLTFE